MKCISNAFQYKMNILRPFRGLTTLEPERSSLRVLGVRRFLLAELSFLSMGPGHPSSLLSPNLNLHAKHNSETSQQRAL